MAGDGEAEDSASDDYVAHSWQESGGGALGGGWEAARFDLHNSTIDAFGSDRGEWCTIIVHCSARSGSGTWNVELCRSVRRQFAGGRAARDIRSDCVPRRPWQF